MGEHAAEIAAVGGQQRLEDGAVLCAELAARERERRRYVEPGVIVELSDEAAALAHGQEQQRALAELALEADVDPFVGEVRVALARLERVVARAEADRLPVLAAGKIQLKR